MTEHFIVSGMTCEGCASDIEKKLKTHPLISDASVSFLDKRASITFIKPISIEDIMRLVGSRFTLQYESLIPISMALPLNDSKSSLSPSQLPSQLKWYNTYKPIFLIFAYLIILSIIQPLYFGNVDIMDMMQRFMAGFFLIFSFFKLLNLEGFARTYSQYDIIAFHFSKWGYIYPFLELGLGLCFLFSLFPLISNGATFILMSVSSVGVFNSVINKKLIQCACVGTVFNLPMSSLTLFENLLMIVMSIIMLYLLIA